MIHESWQSSESPSPLSISYVMASWLPSQSWTTDVTSSPTTSADAGVCRSRLPELLERAAMLSAFAEDVADGMNTDLTSWTLSLGSTSTGGRLSAFQFETPLTQLTSRSLEHLAVCLLFATYGTDESEDG